MKTFKEHLFETNIYDKDVITLGKLEKTGKIVRLLKKAHTVAFSKDKDWLMVDSDFARGKNSLGQKWIPASTKFSWVKEFSNKADMAYMMNKPIREKQEFVSKAGAGEWGRPELRDKYLSDTPGQSKKLYKKYKK
jgi:hypothetical protein